MQVYIAKTFIFTSHVITHKINHLNKFYILARVIKIMVLLLCGGRKGQIAVEYIIMVGFLMSLSLPIISLFLEYSRGSQDIIITTQAYNAARKIVDTAETVYSYGEPSKLQIKVFFPSRIESILLRDKEITFRIRTSGGVTDVVVYTITNLTGSLSTLEGTHVITVEAKNNCIQISE